MSDIPRFSYSLLWEERSLRSVANLTRADGRKFLRLAPAVSVHSAVELFDLEQADQALARLRRSDVRGAAVLTMRPLKTTPAGTTRS